MSNNRQKRSEKSPDELIKCIKNTSWQPARSVEEARARTVGRILGKTITSNFVWKLFLDCPEFFLFEDNIRQLLAKYNPTFMDSTKTARMEEMGTLVKNLKLAANTLYADKFKVTDFIMSDLKNLQEELATELREEERESKSKSDIEASKYNLFDDPIKVTTAKFKSYIAYLTLDTTPIDKFIPTDCPLMANYLYKRNVKTLGDFAKFAANKEYFNKFHHNCKVNYENAYTVFLDNVMAHIKNLEEDGLLKLPEEAKAKPKANKNSGGLVSKATTKKDEFMITKAVKTVLEKDNLSIENLVPSTAEPLLNYLMNQGVTTLADYIKFTSDKKGYWKMVSFAKSCSEDFKTFKKNIADRYARLTRKQVVDDGAKADKNNLDEINNAAEDIKNDEEKPAENLDKIDTNTKYDTSSQNVQLAEFYLELTKTPCKNFVKDSEPMKQIAETRYLLAKEYISELIEQGMQQEEVDKIYNEEWEKFKAIVDAKREEYDKEEKRKSAMLSAMQKRFDDDLKYKRNPKMYSNHERRRENTRNFFHHDDGMNV